VAPVVPQILVEQVHYQAPAGIQQAGAAPAPAWVRLAPEGFSDEPANWAWAPPSPGNADTDADGLPDAWEWRHGFNPHSHLGSDGPDGDPDKDGFGNWQEFRSGTDPRNPESSLRLTPAIRADGARVLTFRTAPGRRYLIEYSDSMVQGTWRVLQRVTGSLESEGIALVDTAPAAQRYYRVTIP
jgi:hypothetical protein